jgi:alpha-2-macroglobulin
LLNRSRKLDGNVPLREETMTTTLTALIAIPLVLLTAGIAAGETRREVVTTENADYYGFDLRAEKNLTIGECTELCLADGNCRAFTYNTRVNWCFLKSDFKEAVEVEGAIAGKIVAVSDEPDIGAPPELEFLPIEIAEAADRLHGEISANAGSDPLSDEATLANVHAHLNRSDVVRGMQLVRQILFANPGDFATYLDVAHYLGRHLDRRLGRVAEFQSLVTSTAVLAYRQSRTASDRAKALAELAHALARQKRYREAIVSFRESLSLASSPEVADALNKLRSEQGFRIIGHTLEADALLPRICVDFSEDLAGPKVEYADFVEAGSSAAIAVSAIGKRLCAEGFSHGDEYRLTLRQGMPSASGETLHKSVDLSGYIRDRAPAVRFNGEKFLLASAARRGVPIVSINAEAAQIALHRIGDRSLARVITDSEFLDQLWEHRIERLDETLGETVWSGRIELERDINRETVTIFPLDEILTENKPGVYVMTAKVAGQQADSWEPLATQWLLVSDIGLITFSGNDGLTVIANSLDSGRPMAGVKLDLLARNNELLGSAVTNAKGAARLDPGLMRGSAGLAPAVLTARQEQPGGHFAFLDLTRAGFDLSDRGVAGRKSPGPLDIFTYLDRGIYRPGETVHAVSLARDGKVHAINDLPLTAIVFRPDGIEAQRIVSRSPLLGGYHTSFDLAENAMRGAWRLAIFTDPDAEPIAEKHFLVEDFLPDRMEFDLTAAAETISPGTPVKLQVDGRYLYGAPAASLDIEGEIRLKTVRELDKAKGFLFGLADEQEQGDAVVKLERLPSTDIDGFAEFDATVATLPDTTRPLIAEFVVRMREAGGRAVERITTLPVRSPGPMIGIKAEFEGTRVDEGSTPSFLIVALDRSGSRLDMSGLNWSLYRIERHYQWYRDGSRWRYEAVEIPELVGNGLIDARAGEFARISHPVGWGRYRLDVESPQVSGPASSLVFEAGWYVETSATETPDALEIALDKGSYRAGDTAILNVTAPAAGELLVTVGANTVLETLRTGIGEGDTQVEFKVADDWGAGAYVTAALIRPGATEASRLPARALGATWLAIDPGERSLDVELDLPEAIRPNQTLEMAVRVAGLAPGEEAFVTVAAVDVGILNLTRYAAPDPSGWYFGQQELGLEIRDLYGRLIDSSEGTFGRIRSGGDAIGMTAHGSPPTEKLLSLFSGIVRLDESGVAAISFKTPQFSGTARIMAVAWSSHSLGGSSKDITIRDPVVLNASLPKVLAPNDRADTVLEIHNTDGESGLYQLVTVTGDRMAISGLPGAVRLAAGERRVLAFSLEALGPGAADISFIISKDGSQVSAVDRSINVRPATLPVTTRIEFPLAANSGGVRIDGGLLADSHIDGSQVSISVSRNKAIDLSALLMRLDRYPYGCAEQTTSRAMPLLYLSDLDAPPALLATADLTKRIEGAIQRVLMFQSANGGFGMWSPSSGNLWLDAYVSDFLTRAREKGYGVPDNQMRLAIQNLQNNLAFIPEIAKNAEAVAYSLYVLARNRMASLSDLRYYADAKLDDFRTPLARAHLGAALALYNEQERTRAVFDSALQLTADPRLVEVHYRRDYYASSLRDAAAMLALAAESPPVAALVPRILDRVEEAIRSRRYTSTQEDAWLVLAARAIEEADRSIALTVNGAPHAGGYNGQYTGAELEGQPLTVANLTGDPLAVVVTKAASPLQPLPASGSGFEIGRSYFRFDGSQTPLAGVHQNERFVVVLTVTGFDANTAQLLVTDLLPGGFEVDNPHLVGSADLTNFKWLSQVEVAHTEFRDDRFVAALERENNAPRRFQLAYVVRAVTPGRYAHPAASVEDMYRPEMSARTASGFLEVLPAN